MKDIRINKGGTSNALNMSNSVIPMRPMCGDSSMSF